MTPDDEELDPTREFEGGEQEGPSDEHVGSTLVDRYEVVERLGSGAMGTVYRAEHVHMGRYDAIKVLSPDMVEDEEAQARFTREARNASRINHRNVCTVYDFGETDDGLPFIAMEYVEGETLTGHLERAGPLSPERAAEITSQVTEALKAAHALDIVHRDLKPENIMLTRDQSGSEVVKVVDFGIAKAMRDDDDRQDVTRAGYVVGTPRYVSPEQVSGGELDGRSDLYSLGIVLFEMLTDELPFVGDNWQAVMAKRLSEEPRSLQDAAPQLSFSPDLQRVVEKALRKDPDERFQSAGDMQEALTAAVQDRGLEATAVDLPATEEVPADGSAADESVSEGGAVWKQVAYGGLAVALLGGGVFFGTDLLGGGTPAGEEAAGPVAGADAPTGQAGEAGEATGGAAEEGGATGRTADDGGARPAGGEGGGEAGPGSNGSGDGGGDAGSGGAEPVADPGGADGGETTTGGEGAGEPVGATGDEAEDELRLSSSRAADMLNRQFVALDSDSPPLRAIGDTARRVWRVEGLPDDERAYAAYILGSSLLEGGDTTDALPWLERAVRLDPEGPGYRTLLDEVRGSRP